MSNQNELQHAATMRTIAIIGIVAGVLSACMGGCLVGMVVVLIRTGRPEIAVIVAMFGSVQSIITGALGYLMPSPMQTQQRRNDAPTGTPAEPITVAQSAPVEVVTAPGDTVAVTDGEA